MESQSLLDGVFEIKVDREASGLLKSMARWAVIVAVAGLTGTGVKVIQKVIFWIQQARLPKDDILYPPHDVNPLDVSFFGLWLIVSVVLNGLLLAFSRHVRYGLNHADQPRFDSGIRYLGHYYRVIGIILLIVTVLIVAVILVSIGYSFIK